MRRRALGIAMVLALIGWLGLPTAKAQESLA
jgi:hypothetical protein